MTDIFCVIFTSLLVKRTKNNAKISRELKVLDLQLYREVRQDAGNLFLLFFYYLCLIIT